MHTLGTYAGASRNLDGDLTISFSVDDEVLGELEKLKDKRLVIDIKKYSAKRSLDANAYFWVLCDGIAKALGTDKEAVYLLQLSRYGVFVDMQVLREKAEALSGVFRYTEELVEDSLADQGEYMTLRCYIGSSHYTRAEMQRLISMTVQDAKDLGVETWTPEEIQRTIDMWEGKT